MNQQDKACGTRSSVSWKEGQVGRDRKQEEERGRAVTAGPEAASGEGPRRDEHWGGLLLSAELPSNIPWASSHQGLPCVTRELKSPGPLCLPCDFGFQKEWFGITPNAHLTNTENSACFHHTHTDTNA